MQAPIVWVRRSAKKSVPLHLHLKPVAKQRYNNIEKELLEAVYYFFHVGLKERQTIAYWYHVADSLSREPANNTLNTKYVFGYESQSFFGVINYPRKWSKANQSPKTCSCSSPSEIRLNDWTVHKSEVSSSGKPYWCFKNDTFIHTGMPFYQNRLIIPESLRVEFLNLLHRSH